MNFNGFLKKGTKKHYKKFSYSFSLPYKNAKPLYD